MSEAASCLAVIAGFFLVAAVLALAVYRQVRHDDALQERLGWRHAFDALSGNLETLGFYLYGHFQYGNRVLSVLCVAYVALLSVFGWWLVAHTPCG